MRLCSGANEPLERRPLCAFLSDNGAGVQIFIEHRRLALRCVPAQSADLSVFGDFEFQPEQVSAKSFFFGLVS